MRERDFQMNTMMLFVDSIYLNNWCTLVLMIVSTLSYILMILNDTY